MIKPSLDKANIILSITVVWLYLYQQWVEPSLDKANINLYITIVWLYLYQQLV